MDAGVVSRRYKFQSNDWLVAPALGLFSERHNDHSGDQLRSTPRLLGSADSTRARICSRLVAVEIAVPGEKRPEINPLPFRAGLGVLFGQVREQIEQNAGALLVQGAGMVPVVFIQRPEIIIALRPGVVGAAEQRPETGGGFALAAGDDDDWPRALPIRDIFSPGRQSR